VLTAVLSELRSLALPVDEHAVFGSGPLIVRGIVSFRNDIDVVCRGSAWERAVGAGVSETLDDGAVVVSMMDGRLTFGRSWMYGGIDVDDVIDSAEIIDGVPFAALEHVERYKRAAGRPKDLEHLVALQQWRATRPG